MKDSFCVKESTYVKDLVGQYGLRNCRAVRLPMDTHIKQSADSGEPLQEADVYQRLVGKLIYLTITRPDIAFIVHVPSKFMHCPTNIQLQVAK